MFAKRTVLLAVALLITAGCGEQTAVPSGQRIIAMAPSTAEILYALGLSNEIVGVSRFCSYPPDVTNKPLVGGLYDPNWELIVALRPTLVIGLKTQKEIETQLKALGIPFLGVSHEHISEIMESILTIGKACGTEKEAEDLVAQLRGQSDILIQKEKILKYRTDPSTADPSMRRDVPAVLVCISRDKTANRCYVAARNTLYDELIERAGGVNACRETAQKYPEVSPEGLIALNPDVIIDIGPTAGTEAWQHYTALPAVQNERIAVITNDYASVPSPRFVKLLADFKEAIQP